MALLEQLIGYPKHKPNRKLGLLRVLKGEARIYKEAPPSTSTLEHIETKVQSTDPQFPSHRYVGYKRELLARLVLGTSQKNGSCLFFQIPL